MIPENAVDRGRAIVGLVVVFVAVTTALWALYLWRWFLWLRGIAS